MSYFTFFKSVIILTHYNPTILKIISPNFYLHALIVRNTVKFYNT